MESLPAYYVHLFNVVSEAVGAIEKQNYGLAKEILLQGQQDAEDMYLDAND